MTARIPEVSDVGGLVDIATGYMAAKQLFAAAEVGLFRALAEGPATAPEIAGRLGIPQNSARILADSLSALGVLHRTDGTYANGPVAAAHLVGGAGDLTPFLAFLDALSYGHWRQFGASVRSGTHGELDLEGVDFSVVGRGIATFHALHATQFAEHVDLSGSRRMLDLGGQSPRFAIEAMQRVPELVCDVVYDEGNSSGVAEALEVAGLRERATLTTMPTLDASPAPDHDVVLLNHVVHRFSAEENTRILRAARAAAAPGATLLLVDFLVDRDGPERAVDALHAAEYLVIDATIVHPVHEVQEWMRATGWEPGEVIELPGSPRVAVARAV